MVDKELDAKDPMFDEEILISAPKDAMDLILFDEASQGDEEMEDYEWPDYDWNTDRSVYVYCFHSL